MKTTLRLTVAILVIVAATLSSAGSRPADADTNTCPGTGPVSLVMDPQGTAVNPGDEFDLVLEVQAGAQEVDVVSAYVDFNPAVFQVVSVVSGSSLPVVLINTVDNMAGTFDYEAGKLGAPFPSGTFTLATVRFQLVAAVSNSSIIFQCGAPRTTEVFRNGTSVLGTLQNAFISLSVTLNSFEASAQTNHVLVSWETISELDNQGFNLWRNTSPTGPAEQLNAALIPSQAPGSSQGFSYTWEDVNVVPGQTYWYWLEDIDLSGAATLNGPVSATAGTPTSVTLGELRIDDQSMHGRADWLDNLFAALREFVASLSSR